MEIDITQNIKDIEGNDINGTKEVAIINSENQFLLNEDGTLAIKKINTPEQKINLRNVCINSLMQSDSESMTGEEKLERYELAMKIKQAEDTIDLNSEQITLIKQLVGKMYSVLVVGQVYKMLEGKNI